ncbi:MAG TPA: UrcA family protein [Steroidobacteraceae bacterium]|nr:UrcA family protein [Steroidobacteraceae bacterium]
MSSKSFAFHARLLTTALGLALAGGAVVAAENVTNITIEAQRSQVVGRSALGAPIELVTISRHVNYADLDLVTPAGAAALEKRVGNTATELCKKLDRIYPYTAKGTESTQSCIKKASDDAMAQVRAAIASVAARK